MLNIPQRKANATARPVKISVVVCSSVWLKLYAAVLATSVFVGWASQSRPAPLTMSQ